MINSSLLKKKKSINNVSIKPNKYNKKEIKWLNTRLSSTRPLFKQQKINRSKYIATTTTTYNNFTVVVEWQATWFSVLYSPICLRFLSFDIKREKTKKKTLLRAVVISSIGKKIMMSV